MDNLIQVFFKNVCVRQKKKLDSYTKKDKKFGGTNANARKLFLHIGIFDVVLEGDRKKHGHYSRPTK